MIIENTTSSLGEDFATLRAQKATWQTDGKGLRGDVTVIRETKAKLIWDNPPAINRAPVDLPA